MHVSSVQYFRNLLDEPRVFFIKIPSPKGEGKKAKGKSRNQNKQQPQSNQRSKDCKQERSQEKEQSVETKQPREPTGSSAHGVDNFREMIGDLAASLAESPCSWDP